MIQIIKTPAQLWTRRVRNGVSMFYQQEMSFLCDVIQKSRLGAAIINRDELDNFIKNEGAGALFYGRGGIIESIPALRHRTLYTFTNRARLSYKFLVLPDTDTATLLAIGPYRTAQVTESDLLEMGESFGISPQKQKHFAEYYESIPILTGDSPVWLMLNTFCERIWQSPSFAVEEIAPTEARAEERDVVLADVVHDGTDVSMKTLERRYAFENEMIRAVEQGQLHVEKQLMRAFSSEAFEKRVQDPLRNAKNYGIIMNTLLRKAAERGGVHPMEIDRVSSEFAKRIEEMASLEHNRDLMCDMFRTYCKLVQEHATAGLPEVVRATMIEVNADLSADLSPSRLAMSKGVSPGYLSTVFKRATGQTLSDYIRERRMEHAAHLLGSTSLQIQTVALHCGIMDVQYFSKLFKRQTGMTPSDYRAARRADR